jgi:hypothetical protein
MSGWSDERLEAAYRSMSHKPAPSELMSTTIDAIRGRAGAQPIRRPFLGGLRTTPLRLGGAAATLTVIAIVAGLALRPTTGPASTEPAGRTEMPSTIETLPVQTVSQALAAEKSGKIAGDALVALRGWYSPMLPASCPFGPARPALIPACGSPQLLITENEEHLVTLGPSSESQNPPRGPYLMALEPDGSDVSALLPAGNTGSAASFDPVPVAIVGHFHDVRSAACSAEQMAACESAFVVDQLAWLDGRLLGPNVWIGLDAGGHRLAPRLDAAGVIAALQSTLDGRDVVVSMAAVRLSGLNDFQPGRWVSGGESPDHPSVQWFVRVAGPEPRYPEMDFRGGSSGWLVLGDDQGGLRSVGGWGFISAWDPAYVARVHRFPSGDLALPTANMLNGNSCAGTGADTVLQGSAADPRIAWLVQPANPTFGTPELRIEAIWPAGYRARFSPGLEILDERGAVVLRAGDPVTGFCAGDNPAYLEPPFR